LHTQRDGSLTITHEARQLHYRLAQRIQRNAPIVGSKELAERPQKKHPMPQMARKPQPNHPWKTTKLPNSWGAVSDLRLGDTIALR
ncbi:MAG: hypothetical protein M3Y18_03965, partial [Candidatus Eremiobacteraeota bacterium]|nr:hypothetical protein [Candidatus Eremiobacteraeota bacterium]